MQITKNVLLSLSNNTLLNKAAQKWGYRLGANQFIAGTDMDSAISSIKKLNEIGISCTVDHLGEFVTERKDSLIAKQNILTALEKIHHEKLDCHISVKLTQLGLGIDESFCFNNIYDIVSLANKYQIFVNIDTENYTYYALTFKVLDKLLLHFSNVGTVIQSYYHHAMQDTEKYRHVRLRLVKGAYKEDARIALQSKEAIDAQFIELIKKRLLGNAFTSIATHDHHIINEVIAYIEEKQIPADRFEFQMLYGFRVDLQQQLAADGYHFCTYIPYGTDWYGYFMRRLAERPQNIELILKDKLLNEHGKIKKKPLLIGATSLLTLAYLAYKKKR